jgi:hypothetical protein
MNVFEVISAKATKFNNLVYSVVEVNCEIVVKLRSYINTVELMNFLVEVNEAGVSFSDSVMSTVTTSSSVIRFRK